MTDNSGELSDVAIAMSVMFKSQRPTTPSECTPKDQEETGERKFRLAYIKN